MVLFPDDILDVIFGPFQLVPLDLLPEPPDGLFLQLNFGNNGPEGGLEHTLILGGFLLVPLFDMFLDIHDLAMDLDILGDQSALVFCI